MGYGVFHQFSFYIIPAVHKAETWPPKNELASIIKAADGNMLTCIAKVSSSPDPSKVYLLILRYGDKISPQLEKVVEAGCTIVPVDCFYQALLHQDPSLLLFQTSTHNTQIHQLQAKKNTVERSKANTKLSPAKSNAKTKLSPAKSNATTKLSPTKSNSKTKLSPARRNFFATPSIKNLNSPVLKQLPRSVFKHSILPRNFSTRQRREYR